MIDVQVAYDKLASLETADEIAEFFRGQNVVGMTNAHDRCAIAMWMQDTTGFITSVSLSRILSKADEKSFFELESLESGLIPTSAMQEFIINFDNLKYPDLVLGNP